MTDDELLDLKAAEINYICRVGTDKFNKGNYLSAIDDFNKAIEMDPDNPNLYNLRGHARYSKGDIKGARSDFSKSKKLKSKGKKAKKNDS
ncbi:MAG: tetratricopeptide repeat protein [Candidatus Aureabacteria bacterium]|nr:tetratricopeptide repeat protein [Candidatus Auribacterota bacterium]